MTSRTDSLRPFPSKWVVLPIAAADAVFQDKKILIVDDDVSVTDTFSRMLRLEGYEVWAALSADEGLTLAQTHRPHAIILDLRMPLTSGLQVLRALRAIPDYPNPGIVFQDTFVFNTTLKDNIHLANPDAPDEAVMKAAEDAAVKRGWNKYGVAMDALTALAVDNGLQHYSQSEYLMGIKKQILLKLSEENIYWGEEYEDFNPGEFNTYLDDLRIIATDKGMKDRGDVKVLSKYLQVRQLFTAALQQRDAAGGNRPLPPKPVRGSR